MPKNVTVRAVLTFVLLAAASGALADPVRTSTLGWIVDGTVSEATRAGDVLYLGGSIHTAAPANKRAYGAVSFGAQSAEALFPALKFDGDVKVVIPDGTGGWFVGGRFSNIGALDRDGLARITPAGTVDETWEVRIGQGFARSTNALVLAGGVLYVGGNFPNAGGQARQHLAAIDVATETVTAWNPGASSEVNTLVLSGDTLYVGGTFATLGGQPRSRLGAVSTAGAGAATGWDPQVDGEVEDLLLVGSTLFAGGHFQNVGTDARDHLAAFALPAGTLRADIAPDVDGDVYALAEAAGTVFVGGSFSTVDATDRDNVAAISATTGALLPWNPDPDARVYDLAVAGGLVYLVGDFDRLGVDTERLHAAAVDAVTGAVAGWNPALNDGADRVFADGTTVHVAGHFSAHGAVVRQNLLAIDLSTGALLPWNPAPNGWVRGLASAGDVVYVAGDFSTVAGVSRTGVVALDAFTGEVVPGWNAQLNGHVLGVLLVGDTLYMAGSFTAAQGTTRNRFAAVAAATGTLTAWHPNANAQAEGLAVDPAAPSVIYLGGEFTTVGGQARNRLAAVDATTGAVAAWNPDANGDVYKLTVLNGVVYAGGAFTSIGGSTRNRAAAIDAGGALTSWNPGVNGPVYDIEAFDDRIYLAGGFSSVGAVSVSGMAIVGTSGTAVDWEQDDVSGQAVSVIDVASDGVFFGGIIRDPFDGSDVGAVFYPETLPVVTPTAPMLPTAVVTGGRARLTWRPGPQGGQPAAYVLEAGTAPGRADIAAANVGHVTEFLTPPLASGTFWLRVRGLNAGGASAPSDAFAFVVGATGCSAPPAAPTAFTTTRVGNAVTFTWRAPVGSAVAGYQLEAGTRKGARDLVDANVGNVTSFQAVAPDGGYWVRLRAYNACGMSLPSADTLVVLGSGGALAGPPLEAAADVAGSTIRVSWQSPPYGAGPFTYVLEAGSSPGSSNIATVPVGAATSVSFSGVPPGVYHLRVRAVNAAGAGPASNDVVMVVR